jgi:hypothetical protein
MRIVIIIAIAYFIAGLYYVWRDTRLPRIRQPSYVRGRHFRPLASATLTWLPITLMIIWEDWRLLDMEKAMFSLGVFVIASWAGFLLF